MPAITDVSKLRPELLSLSPAEIERRITELLMAKEEIAKKEAAETRAKLIGEARTRIETVVDCLKWLEANGFLSEKQKAAYTTAGGTFAPHLSFRAPKA